MLFTSQIMVKSIELGKCMVVTTVNPQNFIHDIFCVLIVHRFIIFKFWTRKCITVPLFCIVLYIFIFFIFIFPPTHENKMTVKNCGSTVVILGYIHLVY